MQYKTKGQEFYVVLVLTKKKLIFPPPHSCMVHAPIEYSLTLPEKERQIHSILKVEFSLQYPFEGVKSMYFLPIFHIATKPVLLRWIGDDQIYTLLKATRKHYMCSVNAKRSCQKDCHLLSIYL